MYGMTHTRFVPSTPADFEELGRWDWLDFARKKDMKGLTESERKYKRAEKVRKKGNRRRAARIEMRAGAREMKEKGKKPLTLKSSPEKLWAVKYPWAERPGQKGKVALYFNPVGTGTGSAPEFLTQPIAKGMRPLSMYRKREWRTTILGGLKALQAAGVPGYDMTTMPDIEMLKPSPKGKDDKKLKEYGGGKKSLSGASGFIRQEVIDNDLEETAWAFRGMLMMQPAIVSAGVRGAAAGIATGIITATLGPWGAIPAAAAASMSAQAAVMQADMKNFQQLAEQGLQKYGAQRAKEAAEVETARINQETQDLIEQEEAAVQEAGEAQARLYTYIAYGALGLVSVVTFVVLRRAIVSRRAA